MRTKAMRQRALDTILDGLMVRYRAHVRDVAAVLALMVDRGLAATENEIENDHIAFRTLGAPHLGIASLEKVFLHLGYARRDPYEFPEKKLRARWYSPPGSGYPRIFISELRIPELSPAARAILLPRVDALSADPVDALDLDDGQAVVEFLHRSLWPAPTWTEYRTLSEESEYAAWVIYNRYYLNHFTIAVHDLPADFNTIERFNRFLEKNGFTLNDSGGKIKVSADGMLLQSSTVAALVDAPFDDGRGGFETHRISGSYVEFIERRVLPQFTHLPPDQIRAVHRREGFEARNADRIFESTFDEQAKRRPGR